jgi:hypothetical protein
VIVEYEHHGRKVKVDEDLQGKHRDHCLCWKCKRFKPGWSLGAILSCPRAKILYLFDIIFGMVTPVYECPKYANLLGWLGEPVFMEEPRT